MKVSPAKEPCLVLRNLAKDMLLARQINEVEYGQAWLVFDRDSHLTFHDAVELGKKIPFIHLAFSDCSPSDLKSNRARLPASSTLP